MSINITKKTKKVSISTPLLAKPQEIKIKRKSETPALLPTTVTNPLIKAVSKNLVNEMYAKVDDEYPPYHSSLAKLKRDDKLRL